MDKIKVLAIPRDNYGVGYFRSIMPHKKLYEKFNSEFEVTIDNNISLKDLNFFKNYDIITYTNYLTTKIDANEELSKFFRDNNIKVVVDIDDYWNVGMFHPYFINDKEEKEISNLIIQSMKNADCITTTTDIFAKEISKFNKNVIVLPNAIDINEEQFIPKPTTSNKLRFGLVMGSSHLHDVSILKDMIGKLTKEDLEKIQIVLCGFDTKGKVPIEHSTWVKYEKILTNDYKLVSDEYKNFLLKYSPNEGYPNVENEMYQRCWTKHINEYAEHYNNIDVLLVPLKECTFNKFKSQLKVIEAGVFGKGIIAQNFEPYKIDLINSIEKGGVFNNKGNAILIDTNNNHKDWYKAIKLLLNNNELLKNMKSNLKELVLEKYDLNKTINLRRDLYINLVE